MREQLNKYPIGSLIIIGRNIERVVAHIENKWHGIDRPWFGFLTVPIHETNKRFWNPETRLPETDKLLEGEIPDQYFRYSVDSSITRFVDIRAVPITPFVTAYTNGYWFDIVVYDTGDRSVGIGSSYDLLYYTDEEDDNLYNKEKSFVSTFLNEWYKLHPEPVE